MSKAKRLIKKLFRKRRLTVFFVVSLLLTAGCLDKYGNSKPSRDVGVLFES
jgi:hypothetical protein